MLLTFCLIFITYSTLFILFTSRIEQPCCLIYAKGIHSFEEEESRYKRLCFNCSRSGLYVSLYRKPSDIHIEHLKKYRNLRYIFVELFEHKKTLTNGGIAKEKIIVVETPSLFDKRFTKKLKFDPKKIKMLFASWNGGSYKQLYERGLIHLLDMLTLNQNLHLVVVLRDKDINVFKELLVEKKVENRVNLVNISNFDQLASYYSQCDFVVFIQQRQVTKDIPNSIIDGMKFGKPCIISKVVGLSNIIEEKKMGICLRPGENLNFSNLTKERYKKLCHNVKDNSNLYSISNYKSIVKYYEQ